MRRTWFVTLYTIIMMLNASPAGSKPFDFCVQGFDLTFSQTAAVRLVAEGSDLEGDAPKLVGELVNRRIWEGRARSLDVRPDQGTTCQAAAGDRVTLELRLDAGELSKIRGELNATQPLPTPSLDALANRVTVSHLMSASDEKSVQSLKVFYATNRHDRGSQYNISRYTGDRGVSLIHGSIEATITTEPKMKWLRSLAVFRILPALKPDKEVRVRKVTPMEAADWKEALSRVLVRPGKSGVLLFVHGYSVTFEDAALRTAQLAADLAFEGAPMFFSWPSKGKIGAYLADKETARASTEHLKALLAELAVLPGSPPVYVIAHSMGNEVLVAALESLYRSTNNAPASFREIVLAAPDVDALRFESTHAKVIVRPQPRVTLYGSATDIALNISGNLQDVPRLGDTSKGVTIIPPMDTIDATAVKVDFLGHSYYGDSRTVMSDLFYLIRGGLPPPERFGLEMVQQDQGNIYWRFK